MRAQITTRGRYYQVDQRGVRYACMSLKPTRAAAGMMYTLARKGTTQSASDDVRRLALYGTLDPLARGLGRMRKRRAKFYKPVLITRWERKDAIEL